MADRTGLWLDDQDTIPIPDGRSFILDTNVLLHDADCLHAFEENNVILTIDVLEELDRFKRGNDEKARNARRVIRDIDSLRNGLPLSHGVAIPGGGRLYVIVKAFLDELPRGMDRSVPDNRILAVAVALKNAGADVVFVTKDINARVKADALGIGGPGLPGHPGQLRRAVHRLVRARGARRHGRGLLPPRAHPARGRPAPQRGRAAEVRGQPQADRPRHLPGRHRPGRAPAARGQPSLGSGGAQSAAAVRLRIPDAAGHPAGDHAGPGGHGQDPAGPGGGPAAGGRGEALPADHGLAAHHAPGQGHRLPARQQGGEAVELDGAGLGQPAVPGRPQARAVGRQGAVPVRHGHRRGRGRHLHPRAQPAQAVHHHRRGPEPDAPRGQDRGQPGRRRRQGRSSPATPTRSTTRTWTPRPTA